MVAINKNYEELFVTLNNSADKRKLILSLIKGSLEFQEDFETILKIKGIKKELKSDVKELLLEINKDYSKLQKLLPNVKNLISFTEKEVGLLQGEANQIKTNITFEEKTLKKTENIIEKIKITELGNKNSVKVPIKKQVKKKLTKVDRIQNNLRFIEEKLKNL
jgi:hypothetical protein